MAFPGWISAVLRKLLSLKKRRKRASVPTGGAHWKRRLIIALDQDRLFGLLHIQKKVLN